MLQSGDELVRKRERLNAGHRQRHLQQWQRRQRTDRDIAAAESAAKAGGHHKGKGHLDAAGVHKRSPFMQELTCDPSGIGFAFGGVEPGTLHAHGQLHEVCKCNQKCRLRSMS